eukprot:m.34634 g.34634  ORF g.34634 m.34634 type:complete len:146 (-) comp15533_c0_seq2:140-577(-)
MADKADHQLSLKERKRRRLQDPQNDFDPQEEIGGVEFGSTGKTKRRRAFVKELQRMMYGFGDVQNPLPESVDTLDDLVSDFIETLAHNALAITPKKTGFRMEDVLHFVRKDRKKFARVKELLIMHDEINKARKALEDEKYTKSST